MDNLKLHQNYTNSVILLTENAVKKIENLIDKQSEASCLYISVHGGGCNGFSYNIDIVPLSFFSDIEKENIIICNENCNTILAVDRNSVPHVVGSTLDYIDELIGSKFIIVKNPNSTSGCGCGSSFSVF